MTTSPRHLAVARNLERHPLKAALSILGLAMAGGLVITSQGMFDSIDYIKSLQFQVVERSDVTVAFRELQPGSAVRAIGREPGVLEFEGFRAVPVRVRHGARTYRSVLLAYAPKAALRRVVTMDGAARRVPDDGILLTQALAQQVGARRGDMVTVEFLEGERRVVRVEVSGINNDLLGAGAYIQPALLERLQGSAPTYSGVLVRADPRRTDSLFARLKAIPAVSGVTVRRASLESFERTIAESFAISLAFTLGFACVIAAGVVYNGARVALSERGRELASLRILGFTRGEVGGMLIAEQAVLTLASFPVAFAVAYGFTVLIATRFDSELFRIPVVVRPRTYLLGTLIVSIAAALSAMAVRRRVDRLDLVAVLKTRE